MGRNEKTVPTKLRLPKIRLVMEGRKQYATKTALNTPGKMADYIRSLYDGDIELIEKFGVLFFDHSMKPLYWEFISKGGYTGTMVDMRVLFTLALKTGATSIVVFHNHPSGNLYPSGADDKVVQTIKEAGKLLEISLIDSIIVTIDGYHSYADNGTI